MENIINQKWAIESKLEREQENLTMLQESLAKSDTLTTNMVSILTSFENRLLQLEETILPVYEETGNLQRRQHNIEQTLSLLDHALNFHNTAREVESVIEGAQPSDDLAAYLECMERLASAIKYFGENNPDSLELSTVVSLHDKGRDVLEREVRVLLSKHSRPVNPMLMLDLLGLDEELPHEDMGIDVHLPNKVLSDLGAISQWLVTRTDRLDFMNAYATIRAETLYRSIVALKDHQKSSSGSSRSMNIPHSPGRIRPTKETPTKRGSKRSYMYSNFMKKATMAKQAIYSLSADPGRMKASVPEDEQTSVDVVPYLTILSAFVKLAQSEIILLTNIIPEEHQGAIFDKLVQKALDTVIEEGDTIVSSVKRSIAKQQYIAVLSIFPVLDRYRQLKPEFDITLEGCSTATRSKMAGIMASFEATGARALEEFIDNFRAELERQPRLPRDGTVHEITSNTMFFLEHLSDLDYGDVAGNVVAAQDPNYKLTGGDDPQANKKALAAYFTRVLSTLGLNLENKAEMYSEPCLKAIFLLNNYNYIHMSLQRSGLVSLVSLHNPEITNNYASQMKQWRRQYAQSWNKLLLVLQDSRSLSLPYKPTDKLKDRDRQLIKDKFTAFNKEMEEIARAQKGFAIPDRELRDSLRAENTQLVLPLYETFLQRYSQYQFTKNNEKYIKYTAEDVRKELGSFFDIAA